MVFRIFFHPLDLQKGMEQVGFESDGRFFWFYQEIPIPSLNAIRVRHTLTGISYQASVIDVVFHSLLGAVFSAFPVVLS